MRIVCVKMSELLLKQIEYYAKRYGYRSRSDFIREACRDLVWRYTYIIPNYQISEKHGKKSKVVDVE